MTNEQLEQIRDAICDTHKCNANCPNRKAEIDNWDGCATCFTSCFYPGYEDWLKKASKNFTKGFGLHQGVSMTRKNIQRKIIYTLIEAVIYAVTTLAIAKIWRKL